MTTLNSPLRITLIIISIIVIGFLIAGIIQWRLAASSQATGFDHYEARTLIKQHLLKKPKSEPSEAIEDIQFQLLSYDIEQFRNGAVTVSDTKSMTKLTEVMPGALQDLLEGDISTKFPYIWPYVMAGSFTIIGNALGDEQVAAFYNPYFDVVLLTKWQLQSDDDITKTGFKLVQAVPITGRAFHENRPSLSTDQPIWSDATELFEVRIVNAAQSFVAAFERRYPPAGRETIQLTDTKVDGSAKNAAIPVIEKRVFSLLRWVIDAQNPDAPVNYATAIEQLRDALSEDTPDEFKALLPRDNRQSAELFFQLGHDIRKEMAPYLVIDKNVIFVSPTTLPTGFISVYFNPSDDGYVVGLASLFNLESNYASH